MAADFVGDPKQGTGGDETGTFRYMARQPILDRSGNVHAYEMLFRNGLTNSFQGDLETATHTMVDNAVMFGLEYLTRGRPAFINWEGNATISAVRFIPAIIQFLGYNRSPTTSALPERSATARMAIGLSQRKLAEKLSVDPATIQDWEAGRHRPIKRSLEVVVRTLQIS